MRLDPRGVLAWLGWRRSGNAPRAGTELADARRLADAERAFEAAPDGCAWLDDRTVDDLDLPLVFRTIDRTTTPTGAQALWRWLAAPALDLEVLGRRERRLAALADPALRERMRRVLSAGSAAADAPLLPRLLWEPPVPRRIGPFVVLVGALAILVLLALWWPPLLIPCALMFGLNAIVDDWANLRLAHQARALEILGSQLALVDRLVNREHLPADLIEDVGGELAPLAVLRKWIGFLSLRDPFGLIDLVRAGLLLRLFLLDHVAKIVARERPRLRRIVIWLGELDAASGIAELRTEHADVSVPELSTGAPHLVGRAIIHPAIPAAVGNDLALAGGGLLVTGSNMSGKSTFLRAIAVNAICAQSIHTTFGHWRASVFRVGAVMRVTDDTGLGVSMYAMEVAAIQRLVAAVTGCDGEPPALSVLDEPFRGTNPAVRVPIVVSVLEYLAERGVVLTATHDLEVAAQVGGLFTLGYFRELDPASGTFDHRIRPGVSPSTNAPALLERAGYPASLVGDVERRIREAVMTRRL